MSNILNRISSAIESNEVFYLSQLFDIYFINRSRDVYQTLASSLSQIKSQIRIDYWVTIIQEIGKMAAIDPSVPNYISQQYPHFAEAASVFIKSEQNSELICIIFKKICNSSLYFARDDDCYDTICNSVLNKAYQKLNLVRKTTMVIDDPILTVICSIVKVYLMKNNYDGAYKAFDSFLEINTVDRNTSTVSELATYYFLKGKIDMVYNNRNSAFFRFKQSLELIPLDCVRDRRLVYAHSIPVSFTFGLIPNPVLLEKYRLVDAYGDLATAISTGDLALFDSCLARNELLYIYLGVWDMVVQSKKFVHRRILEMVHREVNDNKVPIEAFQRALSLFGKEYSINETILVIANLQYEKLVATNIAYQSKLILFNPGNEFSLPVPEDKADD